MTEGHAFWKEALKPGPTRRCPPFPMHGAPNASGTAPGVGMAQEQGVTIPGRSQQAFGEQHKTRFVYPDPARISL